MWDVVNLNATVKCSCVIECSKLDILYKDRQAHTYTHTHTCTNWGWGCGVIILTVLNVCELKWSNLCRLTTRLQPGRHTTTCLNYPGGGPERGEGRGGLRMCFTSLRCWNRMYSTNSSPSWFFFPQPLHTDRLPSLTTPPAGPWHNAAFFPFFFLYFLFFGGTSRLSQILPSGFESIRFVFLRNYTKTQLW